MFFNMCTIDIIDKFLKLIRIFGLFPYQWNLVKNPSIENQESNSKKCFESTPSQIEQRNKCKFRFRKCKTLSFLSNSISFIIISLAAYRIYSIMVVEIGSTTTYQISVPIFGGIMHCSSILIAVHINSKSKKLSKIFKDILKVISKSSPMQLSPKLRQYDIIICLFFFTVVFLINISSVIQCLINKNYPYVFTYIYYACIQTQVFFIFLKLKIICHSYTHLIKSYLGKLPINELLKYKKITNVEIVENNLEFSISKFWDFSQHQKLINSYFGPLISYVLISHICWLILLPLVIASDLDASNPNILNITKNIVMFLWPFLNICFIAEAPDLLIKKVTIHLFKLEKTSKT